MRLGPDTLDPLLYSSTRLHIRVCTTHIRSHTPDAARAHPVKNHCLTHMQILMSKMVHVHFLSSLLRLRDPPVRTSRDVYTHSHPQKNSPETGQHPLLTPFSYTPLSRGVCTPTPVGSTHPAIQSVTGGLWSGERTYVPTR